MFCLIAVIFFGLSGALILQMPRAEAERGRIASDSAGPPILGIHVVVGPSFRQKMRNGYKALVEGRIRLINAVLVRA
jgi:hypothetical protein